MLACAALLTGEALATADDPSHCVIWGGLGLAAYAWGLLCLVGSRWPALGLASWKLGPWTLVWCGAAFGLATLTWSQPQSGTALQISLPSVLKALWLVAGGLTAWTAGYLMGPGQMARRVASRVVTAMGRSFGPSVRGPLTPWCLYAVGVCARLGAAATTGLVGYVGDPSSAVSTASGYGEALSLLSLCAPLAVAAAALQVYRERLPGARITMYVLFGIELAFGAAAGGKQNFIIAVLAVLIPRSGVRLRLPKPAVIVAILIFLVVIIPFNQAYRDVARGGSDTLTARQAITQAPSILSQAVTSESPIKAVPGSVDYLLLRIREIDSPAIIVQRTPTQIGYLSSTQLVTGPLAGFVPRAIWKNKPILASGYQLNQEYYGLPSDLYTSAAVTPLGDLYRHGGWVPVIVGMLLLGCGVRLVDEVLDIQANPQAVFLLLLLFPVIVKGEEDWTNILASIPATLLLWLFAVACTFKRRGHAHG
ncbi:MAG: hypothetical protein ACRDRJ_02615 [Streptosporangiaceae bacterium]